MPVCLKLSQARQRNLCRPTCPIPAGSCAMLIGLVVELGTAYPSMGSSEQKKKLAKMFAIK